MNLLVSPLPLGERGRVRGHVRGTLEGKGAVHSTVGFEVALYVVTRPSSDLRSLTSHPP